MSDFCPVRLFTWRTINHEFVKKRYGWPPFGWKIVEGPELAPEAYYDADDVLAESGILLRTRPLESNGRVHIEALKVDPRGPFVNIERHEINNLITYHFQRSTGATTVKDLDPLCVMKTTRTIMEAKEKFRGGERKFNIVLDRTIWYVAISGVTRALRAVPTVLAASAWLMARSTTQ